MKLVVLIKCIDMWKDWIIFLEPIKMQLYQKGIWKEKGAQMKEAELIIMRHNRTQLLDLLAYFSVSVFRSSSVDYCHDGGKICDYSPILWTSAKHLIIDSIVIVSNLQQKISILFF